MRPPRPLAPALAASVVFTVPRADAPRIQAATIEPARVEMTMFFTGSRVRVSAPVGPDARVAVVLAGEERTISAKRKGKVLGLLWMNVGDVSFEAVPDVYLLRTSCPLGALADRATLYALGLGMDALGDRSTDTAEDRALFDELVRLKWDEGLWQVAESSVTLQRSQVEAATLATTEFLLPARTPPGRYRVSVYAFEDGRAEVAAEGTLVVVQAGAAALVSNLATHHGLLYGILAVVVAGAAGLLTGVVFGAGSGKGH
jgi:uncharacterized protein (TIGR02186 family)